MSQVLVSPGIVHGFIGHTRAHRTIADHRNDIVVPTLEVARRGHAQASRNRGGGVRGAKRIVLAFAALGETR